MITEVSTFRLTLLRATYVLMAIGLATTIWPGVLSHSLTVSRASGLVSSMLAAVGLLAVIGIRYPLQMLPLMFFEFAWKAIWLLAYALPLWMAGQMDAATATSAAECLLLVIFPIVIPWPYVIAHYVRKPGERWGRTANLKNA